MDFLGILILNLLHLHLTALPWKTDKKKFMEIKNLTSLKTVQGEIWIADLNGDGSTRLFSLEDEQVRIAKVLDQNYMDNVWGGVPVFEE